MIRQIFPFISNYVLGFFIKLEFMGLVEAIFFRQIGGAKDSFLQSHPYHISDDDIAKIDESFLLSFLMLHISFLYSQVQHDDFYSFLAHNIYCARYSMYQFDV